MEVTIRGIGVSPGIAIGPALTFGVQAFDIPKYQVENVDTELARFERAVISVRADIERLYERTAEAVGEEHADIFKAHLMFLEDVTLRDEVERRVVSEALNAEYLVGEWIARYTKLMASVPDARFRERTQDLVDVGNRILARLLNANLESLDHLEHPSVIVAHDLSPSDAAKLDMVNTLGIATDVSGPTSHTAILARAFEIPAVVGLKFVGSHALPGDTIIVDGRTGVVVVRPSAKTRARYEEEKVRSERSRAALQAKELKPSVTLDGHEVPAMANIELPVEISHSLKTKAQGIGLYRTEYLFLNRATLPTEEEQYEAYAEAARAMAPATVTLRTLDLGGDKFVSHLHLANEINPQLGWRAIRFCLERPDIFKAQLRAMFRASVHGNVQIMFPLISGVDELRHVKSILQEVCVDLERRGVPFKRDIPIGSMIEVPSAVEVADLLAKECDFFSIGTNDLIQYSLAVDRVNEKIAHMYEPAHPAVLRMIRRTIKAAKAAGIPCGVCGEMAGDPMFSEVLVGLGISSLSMSAVAIPVVRSQVASIRYSLARRFASRILNMGSVAEVREALHRRYSQRGQLDPYAEGAADANIAGAAGEEEC
ncbi:MAG: phosphoenolpyruvate--protein phosphotransferase [Candidatus Hydrogenedentes bacterium]|nr:phosphoenolpyruvate--protein phosphotransferase [Candidatus Hydrogenedentota bacterium]